MAVERRINRRRRLVDLDPPSSRPFSLARLDEGLEEWRMVEEFWSLLVDRDLLPARYVDYYKMGRSMSTSIKSGSALAFTSVVLDIGWRTTRADKGKQYYPYTTKKRISWLYPVKMDF